MNSMYEVKCDHRPHVAKCMHRFTDPQTTIHRTQKNQHLQKAWLSLASMYILSLAFFYFMSLHLFMVLRPFPKNTKT